MKPQFLALLLLSTSIVLTACASPIAERPLVAPSAPVEEAQAGQEQALTPAWEQSVRVDEKGAVVMEVTPLNLNSQSDTLAFEVSMNTHSVDLSMDLAQLATLTTDTGVTLGAAEWDGSRGGHHVSGKLLFPSSVEGKSILDGATNITIQVRDVDVPIRTFEWLVQ